jgi:hypothetical protein
MLDAVVVPATWWNETSSPTPSTLDASPPDDVPHEGRLRGRRSG